MRVWFLAVMAGAFFGCAAAGGRCPSGKRYSRAAGADLAGQCIAAKAKSQPAQDKPAEAMTEQIPLDEVDAGASYMGRGGADAQIPSIGEGGRTGTMPMPTGCAGEAGGG